MTAELAVKLMIATLLVALLVNCVVDSRRNEGND